MESSTSGYAKLKSHIKTIGLYNTKAANILKTCRLLLERHGGEVPDTREQLMALPGVGRKTANVILNTAFGHADDCRRHPCFSGIEPHRHRAGQGCADG